MTNNKKIIIFLLFSIFCFLLSAQAFAATLYLLPHSQDLFQNETFITEIRLNTDEEEINALEANLEFPPSLLEVLDISKGGSILSLWPIEPFFSNSAGKISMMGGIPGGFKGQGMVAQITFRGKELGRATLNFKETSQALLNDGKGTPTELNFLEGNYEIILKPPELPIISSRTHPDQNKWYKQNTLHLHWDLIEGAEYSYLLSKDPLAEPDEIPDRPEGELVWMGDMEFPDLEDGIYYFVLKQKLPNEDWQRKVSFRAMIDMIPPEPFTLEIAKDPSVFEGKYFLSFYTTDKTSGLDYFEIREGKREPKKITSPYLLEDQSLQSKVIVRAIDKAGNEAISEILPPEKPFPYLAIILVLIGIAIIFGVIRARILMKNKNQTK